MQKYGRSILAVVVAALLLVPMISAPVALAGEGSSLPAVQTLAMPEITLEKCTRIYCFS